MLSFLGQFRRLRKRATSATEHPARNEALEVEDRLVAILGMVNEWLQYAEAKNAGAVALSGLAATGLLSILGDLPDGTLLLRGGLLVAVLLAVLSVAVGVWSFLPRTNPDTLAAKGRPEAASNLYFFGHLARYDADRLAAEIAHRYAGIPNYDPAAHPSHRDLANQIVLNSRITMIKNEQFRRAAWLLLIALAVSTTAAVVSLAFCR